MPTVLPSAVLTVLEKALVAWEKYLATRQEAYERKMDRNLRRSNAEAAEAFRRMLELGIEVEDKQFQRAKRLYYHYRDKL